MFRNKAFKFISILLLISWSLTPIIYLSLDNTKFFVILIGFIYMPLPAMITLFFYSKKELKETLFKKIKIKYLIYTILYVYLFNIINIMIIFIITLFFNDTYLSFDAITVQENLQKMVFLKNETLNINIDFSKVLILLLLSPLLGIFNLPFAIGEELAWRGYLYDKIEKKSILRHNVFIGFVWGIWHAPVILMGYNFPKNPFFGLLIFICFTITLSFLLFYLRKKYDTVLAPSLFHAAFNSSALISILFVKNNPSDLLINPVGITGIISVILINIFLVKLFLEK